MTHMKLIGCLYKDSKYGEAAVIPIPMVLYSVVNGNMCKQARCSREFSLATSRRTLTEAIKNGDRLIQIEQ
jgi:hypothetical protein